VALIGVPGRGWPRPGTSRVASGRPAAPTSPF